MALGLKQMPISSGVLPRWIQQGIAVLGVLLMLAGLGLVFHSIRGNPVWMSSVDLGVYVTASHCIWSGQSPYNAVPNESAPAFYGKPDSFGYGYPPVLAELLVPGVLAGDAVVRYGWFLLSAALLIASIIWLMRGFGPMASWPWTLLACGVVTFSRVSRNDLYHGQANFLLLFLLIGGLWLLWKQKGTSAGLVWGLMIVIKPFLGILLLYLLRRREYRAAGVCLACAALLLALSFGPLLMHGLGLGPVRQWMMVSHWYGSWARPDNFSLHGVFLRIFTVNPYTLPWTNSPLAVSVLDLIVVAVLAALFWWAVPFQKRTVAQNTITKNTLTRNVTDRSGGIVLAETGLLLVLCLTYGPLTEGDHLLLLLPGLVGIWQLTYPLSEQKNGGTTAWGWTAAVWTLFFLMLLNPVRGLPQFGLPNPMEWVPLGGPPLLWTSQVALLLIALVSFLTNALHQDGRTKTSIVSNRHKEAVTTYD